MHELPVTESILKIALRHAQQNSAVKITQLHLVIGQLSSVIDDSIRFYWDMVAEGTLAEGAVLHFRRIPVEMQCQSCRTSFTPVSGTFSCPSCQSASVKVVRGDEFFLESIDIEKAGNACSREGNL